MADCAHVLNPATGHCKLCGATPPKPPIHGHVVNEHTGHCKICGEAVKPPPKAA